MAQRRLSRWSLRVETAEDALRVPEILITPFPEILITSLPEILAA